MRCARELLGSATRACSGLAVFLKNFKWDLRPEALPPPSRPFSVIYFKPRAKGHKRKESHRNWIRE